MMDDFEYDTINALDDLLEIEHAALISGDIEKVTRLHERKSALLESLAEIEIKPEERLTLIGQKLDRNQALLGSAIEGIRSVARRLAAVRRVRDTLDTYDAKGHRKSVATKSRKTLEKRA